MASYILFAVFCLLGTYVINSNGNEHDDWFLNLNNFALYEMIKERGGDKLPFGEQAKSVLEAICEQHQINLAYVETDKVINNLRGKLYKLWTNTKVQLSKGGRQGLAVIEKLKSTTYKLNFAGYKRKVEHDLESEKKRRRIAEERATERKHLVKNFKKKARAAYVLLGRLTKRRVKPKRNVKGKLSYSKSWRRFKKRQMEEVIGCASDFLSAEGITMEQFRFVDNSAKITVEKGQIPKIPQVPVDRALYKKDSNLTSNEQYHDYATEAASGYPPLCQVLNLKKELDALFDVKRLPLNEGVYEDLESKLVRVLEALPNFDEGKVTVKISGDGTSMGKRIHVTNYVFSVFTDNWRSDDLILVIANTPEKYSSIQAALRYVASEICDIQQRGVSVKGKLVEVKFIVCADLKFTNEMLGLNACSSTYACAWCKCPSSHYSQVHVDYDARTIQDIESLSTRKKSKTYEPYGCLRPPILLTIPINHYIPDPLHMYLRISDQLINKLVEILKKKDNIEKNSKNVCVAKCQNISNFQTFIRSLGIPWYFATNKETGRLEHRDFTGPEHRKIQAKISLSDLIPWHTKLQQTEQLWCKFHELTNRMKKEMCPTEIANFKADAMTWVSDYARVYLAKDVTIYMHIFAKHVDESITLHGNISTFSQQSFEKLNDRITQWYFKGTNHQSLSALEQIMYKQNRIEYLEPTCQRQAKYRVTCKLCGEQGHNRRTCPQKD